MGVSLNKSLAISFLLLLSTLAATPYTFATEGHIALLAVAESSKGLSGAIADLSLEIRPGKGRVFLETYPPTKEDTQISMRFAKQVACSHLEIDCNDKDFIFTIRAGPGIVGGPSAGAAATILTISMLSNRSLAKNIAVTGTINSGGIIGPVGGLKSKIHVASKNGIKTALIPLGTKISRQRVTITIERNNSSLNSSNEEALPSSTLNETSDIDEDATIDDLPQPDPPVPLIIANITLPKNETLNISRQVIQDIDLEAYGKTIGITVKEVGTIEDALFAFTGEHSLQPPETFTLAPEYVTIMSTISDMLCTRAQNNTQTSKRALEDQTGNHSKHKDSLKEPTTFLNLSEDARIKKDYYSAASYCFRASIQSKAVWFSIQNLSDENKIQEINQLENERKLLQATIDGKRIKTITDLQAAMVTLERLEEAKEVLEALQKDYRGREVSGALAFASERLESVKAWNMFFGTQSTRYTVDEQKLKTGCEDKIREAQERLDYVHYYIPNSLIGVKKNIEQAVIFGNEKRFQKCLHKASLAKAEANLVASLIGADAKSLPLILDQKLAVVKRSIAKAQHRGYFPILGYSYFEYATSLKTSDQGSALLFAEYALELSNLEIYFDHPLANEQEFDTLSLIQPYQPLLTGQAVRETVHLPSGDLQWTLNKNTPLIFMAGFILGICLMLAIAGLSYKPLQGNTSDQVKIKKGK